MFVSPYRRSLARSRAVWRLSLSSSFGLLTDAERRNLALTLKSWSAPAPLAVESAALAGALRGVPPVPVPVLRLRRPVLVFSEIIPPCVGDGLFLLRGKSTPTPTLFVWLPSRFSLRSHRDRGLPSSPISLTTSSSCCSPLDLWYLTPSLSRFAHGTPAMIIHTPFLLLESYMPPVMSSLNFASVSLHSCPGGLLTFRPCGL